MFGAGRISGKNSNGSQNVKSSVLEMKSFQLLLVSQAFPRRRKEGYYTLATAGTKFFFELFLISFSFLLLALFRRLDSRSTFPSRLRRPRLQRVIGIVIVCATSGTNLIFLFPLFAVSANISILSTTIYFFPFSFSSFFDGRFLHEKTKCE